MYRKSIEMADVQAESVNPKIVDRVSQLPVVASAYDYATQYYAKAKEYNNLVKVTLDTAEKSIKFAADSVGKPVAQKFEKPIGYADQVLTNQFDSLEKKFPIISKTPEEIAKEAREKYATTVGPIVQPAVDRVSYGIEKATAVKDYGVQTATAVKDYGVEKAGHVKDYGLQKANELLDTKYGRVVSTTVTTTVNKTLSVADQYVDYYLPAAEDEDKEDSKMDVDDPMVARVTKLSSKLKRRVQRVTLRQLEQVQKSTRENLAHLNIVLDLLQNAKGNLDTTNLAVKDKLTAARAKAQALWEELNKEQEEEDQEGSGKTLEQRSLALARLATKRLVNLYNTASSSLTIPVALQPAIAQAQHYATDLYEQVIKIKSFEDATNLVVSRVRDTGKTIQETVNNLREQAANFQPNLEWVAKNSEENNENKTTSELSSNSSNSTSNCQ